MSRAGIETTSGESVEQSGDKRLLKRFATTEAVTTDLFLIEVDFAPHEPMRPEWIDSQHGRALLQFPFRWSGAGK
jgi:hypothetical protein